MRFALVVVLVGCGSGDPDVAPDSPPEPRCASWPFQPHLVDACALPDTDLDLQLTRFETSYVLDGNTGTVFRGESEVEFTLPRMEIDGMAVFTVGRFALGPSDGLTVEGDLPVVIVSWEDIDVQGGINAQPNADNEPGAGAPAAECTLPGIGGANAGSGGGGFRGVGGPGGDSETGTPGAAGGLKRPLPSRLSAGCNGADSAVTPGSGGKAGGALALIARTSLTIANRISVNGGAGTKDNDDGGAGGGSGGMLELEAATITVTGSAELSSCGAPGAPINVATQGCSIDGAVGADGTATVPVGQGGSGAGGYLMFRAHDSASVDPDAVVLPSLLPF